MGNTPKFDAQGYLVTGIFPNRESAESAFGIATEHGYTKDDVNILMSDETRKRSFADENMAFKQTELGTKVAEGAEVGGAIGGTLGAIAGAIAAAGTNLALPGLGLVVAGPVAAAIAGAGVGAASGGLIGALVGWNIPEERVATYEKGLKDGGILVGVNTKDVDDAISIENRWRSHGQVYR